MRSLIIIIATLPLLLLGAAPVPAHTQLERSSPAAGNSLAAAPKEVVLSFTSNLEPAFSTIEVQDASGAAMQTGKSVVDPKLRTQMRVPLKALPPGTYKVIWRVLSVDTHRTQGSFTFRVGP